MNPPPNEPSAKLNPFADDVCPGPYALGKEGTVESLNSDLLDQLLDAVEGRAGVPPILLTAPRAGYGKTHLLGRVVAAAGAQAVMVPLAFKSGDKPDLGMLTRRGIEALARAPLPNAAGWSRLREACGGVLAVLMRGLIEQGTLPCANPAQALQLLAGPVTDVFDAQGPARAISAWLTNHAGSLRPLLARAAARRVPATAAEIERWLDALVAQAVEGGQAGLAEMRELACRDVGGTDPVWLLLTGLWRPVVLLVDHLDGYYRNVEAGIAIASLLMDLVEAHGIHVLMSLNQDVWQATFGHHLPSALEDRLTASRVLLRGLREADAAEMLRLRLKQAGVSGAEAVEFTAFVDVRRHFLGRPVGSVSARAFLRHCAQQWELFQTAPAAAPSPLNEPDSEEGAPPLLPAVNAEAHTAAIPLPLETETLEEELPGIFDSQTRDEVKLIAEGLTEPKPALPQDGPLRGAGAMAHGGLDFPAAAQAAVAPAADAFVKLREMLHRLREPSAEHPFTAPAAPASAGLNGQPSTSLPTAEPPPPKPDATTNLLMGRFGALRLQMQAEASSQPLDYGKLTELVRLAGRRFPLVRLSEHELPGLTGRHTLCWSLQGLEILFGLASPSDTMYWKTLAAFCAGLQADNAELATREAQPQAKLKWVVFATEREQTAVEGLIETGIIPEPLRDVLHRIHLDVGEVAALYAMQRIIKEAETGVLLTEPAQVMSVLARELDFFWKRVTRV